MGYRLLVAICSLAMLCSCAAFDNSSEPYTGFSPDEIPPPQGMGMYTGYYAGDMTLGSNGCQSVSDKVGDKIPLALDVAQKDADVQVTFEDGTVVTAALASDAAEVMTEVSGVKHIYKLTFGENGVSGSCDVIEADANGQYMKACANYTLSLTETEKPDEAAADSEAETEGGGQ